MSAYASSSSSFFCFMIVEFLKNSIKLGLFGRFTKYLPAFLDKMLTLGHLQASLHGSRSIAFFDKMLTLGHLQASLHGSRLIAFLHRSDFGDVGGSETRLCAKDHASTSQRCAAWSEKCHQQVPRRGTLFAGMVKLS